MPLIHLESTKNPLHLMTAGGFLYIFMGVILWALFVFACGDYAYVFAFYIIG